MLAGADTDTISAREVCCIDSTARDVGYNRQLEAGGGSWRAGGVRVGRGGQMTRLLLLFAVKRSLVGGILVCLLESQRKRNRAKREREKEDGEGEEEGKSVVRIYGRSERQRAEMF